MVGLSAGTRPFSIRPDTFSPSLTRFCSASIPSTTGCLSKVLGPPPVCIDHACPGPSAAGLGGLRGGKLAGAVASSLHSTPRTAVRPASTRSIDPARQQGKSPHETEAHRAISTLESAQARCCVASTTVHIQSHGDLAADKTTDSTHMVVLIGSMLCCCSDPRSAASAEEAGRHQLRHNWWVRQVGLLERACLKEPFRSLHSFANRLMVCVC